MSSLTIDNTYTGGLSQAIADATSAGHNIIYLQPGVYAAATVTSAEGIRGPGQTVVRMNIMPFHCSRSAVVINDFEMSGANYIRFINCTFGTSGNQTPATRILPIFSAGVRHTISMSGTSGGTFTLTFKGQTTTALAWNATAATVSAAVIALSNVNTGDVTDNGGGFGGDPDSISLDWEYDGAYGGLPIHNDLTANTGSLTGPAPLMTITPSVIGTKDTNGAGITITPVVTDSPVPRLRVRGPQIRSSQAESLSISIAPGTRDVTVSGVGTDANGRVTTTAQSLVNALNGNAAVTDLFTAAVTDGHSGTGVVSGGFPYWHIWSNQNGGDWIVDEGTHHNEVIGCEFLQGSHTLIRGRCHDIKVHGCKFLEANFALNMSGAAGAANVSSQIWYRRNYMYGGYNTDASALRPSNFRGMWLEDNIIEGTVDAPESALHVDTWQPINNGYFCHVRRNKFIDHSGQMWFMSNFQFHHLYIENNVFHQFTESGYDLNCSQLGKVVIFRHNTLDVHTWLWSDGNTHPDEDIDSVLVFNNIASSMGKSPLAPIHDYNIIADGSIGDGSGEEGANETGALPAYMSDGQPDFDYRFLDASQPGVGTGTADFRGWKPPATDIKGNVRPVSPVDMGAYVSGAASA